MIWWIVAGIVALAVVILIALVLRLTSELPKLRRALALLQQRQQSAVRLQVKVAGMQEQVVSLAEQMGRVKAAVPSRRHDTE